MSMLDRIFENEKELVRIVNPISFDNWIGSNPSGGVDYYVDNNVGTGGDGLTWKTPMKNLSVAIAASNKSIGLASNRFWARRNRIFFCGDLETVDLTVFPSKCDVIGVGSYDANTQAGIAGNHAPVNASNYGTRFVNIWFKAPAVASPIVTLANTSSGTQFIGCMFDGILGTVTSGILSTAHPFMKVIGCTFQGTFATSCISFGTGEAGGTVIDGNWMAGSASTGIVAAADTTTSFPSIIKENTIVVTDSSVCINDASNLFYCVNNRLINQGTVTAWAHHTAVATVNADFAAGNLCTGSAGNQVTLGTTVGS